MAFVPSWVVAVDDIANGKDVRLHQTDAKWLIESVTKLNNERKRLAERVEELERRPEQCPAYHGNLNCNVIGSHVVHATVIEGRVVDTWRD